MNTNMTGFRWILILSILVYWTKVASALEGLKDVGIVTIFITDYMLLSK